MMPFFYIHISQGSVATCLKRGRIFKHKFVANLLPSRLVKTFRKSVIVSEVMAKSWVSCFLTHGVDYVCAFSFKTLYLGCRWRRENEEKNGDQEKNS